MSQINSYAKSNKLSLCMDLAGWTSFSPSEQTHAEIMDVAGIFPGV